MFAILGFEADSKDVKTVNDVIGGIRNALAGIAGFLAARGGIQFLSNSSKEIEDIQLLSDSLEITTDQAQELEFAFGRLGLPLQDVRDALTTLTDRSEDAQAGMQSMKDDFALVGLSIDEMRGKDPVELFTSFAEAIHNTENANKAATAAVRTFGDDLGQRLLPLLKQGEAGLMAIRQQAHDLGLVLDPEQIKQTKEFRTQLFISQSLMQGIGRLLTVELAPAMNDLLVKFIKWFEQNKKLIRQNMRGVVDALAFSFRLFFGVMMGGLELFAKFQRAVGGATNAFKLLGIVLVSLALSRLIFMFQKLGLTAMLAGIKAQLPWLSLAGLIALVLLALEDIWGWVEGKDSLIGSFLGPASEAAIQKMRTGLMLLLGIFIGILALISAPLALVMAIIAGIVLLIVYWDQVKAAFINMFKEVGMFFYHIVGLMILKVLEFLAWIAKSIAKGAAKLWFPIEDAFRNMVIKVKAWFTGLIDDIKKSLRDALNIVGKGLDKAKGLINKIPGVSIGDNISGQGLAASIIGGGALSPGVDMQARADRRESSRPQNNSFEVAAVNISAPGGDPEEVRRATAQGLEDGYRKANNDFDGQPS
jgi:hypothetical protein